METWLLMFTTVTYQLSSTKYVYALHAGIYSSAASFDDMGTGSNTANARVEELCPVCAELNQIPSLHHIVAVNDASGSATLDDVQITTHFRLSSTGKQYSLA